MKECVIRRERDKNVVYYVAHYIVFPIVDYKDVCVALVLKTIFLQQQTIHLLHREHDINLSIILKPLSHLIGIIYCCICCLKDYEADYGQDYFNSFYGSLTAFLRQAVLLSRAELCKSSIHFNRVMLYFIYIYIERYGDIQRVYIDVPRILNEQRAIDIYRECIYRCTTYLIF